jgi:8-oxo-dGTP pyrophosphatase MutT (NUDIX family)
MMAAGPAIWERLRQNPLEVLRGALLAQPPDHITHDDFDLHPELRPAEQSAAIEAAVLLPLIARNELTLLFTRRTETLSRHSGQVSFPGGRRDPGDLSPVETALRETMEETGIAPAFVSVAGFLPRYRTGTGFDILPVVGLLSDGFALAPDRHEVAEIFEVPLAFFLDPANRRKESREWGGKMRDFYAFHPGAHYIWGATAAILSDFAARLTGATVPHDAH